MNGEMVERYFVVAAAVVVLVAVDAEDCLVFDLCNNVKLIHEKHKNTLKND